MSQTSDNQISGALQSEEYIDEIDSLIFKWGKKTLMITGISVQTETFGSEDANCVYSFIAKDFGETEYNWGDL